VLKVTAQVVAPGAESAVYDCLVCLFASYAWYSCVILLRSVARCVVCVSVCMCERRALSVVSFAGNVNCFPGNSHDDCRV